jgi:hypothetical protein
MKKKFFKRLACVGVAGIMGLSTIGLSGCSVDWQELGANVLMYIVCGPWLLVDAIKGVFSPKEERTERDRINDTWEIELPENETLEYELTSKDLYRGEGLRYHVFRYEEEPTEFISTFIDQNQYIQDNMTEFIDDLLKQAEADSIPQEYEIDWSDKIVWKNILRSNRQDRLYLIYSADEKRLFTCENIL